MQDLRLVGVQEGGEHLLLSGNGGETFRLRIDEALRVAASRQVRRLPAPQDNAGSSAMAPRDIQARIRAGASAEEVARESGLELAHIRRYEGPVRAERDYIAGQAQAVEVAAPLSATHDGYRTAFGENPVSLGAMVAYRLRSFGVNPDSVQWDAWRRPDGTWDVVARFDLDEKSRVAVGEEPPARWTFSPLRKGITNANRWAQLLSELEPLDSPLPSRRLTAVSDRVFDFEADQDPDAPSGETVSTDTDNILEVLRLRRGQRLGVDEEGDDALAAMLAKGSVPAARDEDSADSPRPRTGRLTLATGGTSEPASLPASLAPDAAADGPDGDGGSEDSEVSVLSRPFRRRASRDGSREVGAESAGTAGSHRKPGQQDPAGQDAAPRDPARRNTARTDPARTEPQAAAPQAPKAPAAERTRSGDFPWERLPEGGRDADPKAGEGKAGERSERRSIKPKRSSVPSWDEIVFGTKGD